MIGVAALFAQEQDTIKEQKGTEIFRVEEEGMNTTIFIGNKTLLKIVREGENIKVHLPDKEYFEVKETENGVSVYLGKEQLISMIGSAHENEIYKEETIVINVSEDIAEAIEKGLHEILTYNERDSVVAIAQNGDIEVQINKNENLEVIERKWRTIVEMSDNEDKFFRGDTTSFRLGDKEIEIVEEKSGRKHLYWDDKKDGEWKDKNWCDEPYKFKGHWAGWELGYNNYLTPDYSMSLPANEQFIDLDFGKSFNTNINFMQYSLGFGKKAGLVTGLGLNFNNYRFANQNSIAKDTVTRYLVEYTPRDDISKSKLTVLYLSMPLLFEFQLPMGDKKDGFFISAGGIGGVKVGSHTKVVYYEDGNKQKLKNRNDFNLNPIKYGVTARIGFRALKIYCNYYLSSLFNKNEAPELYPFSFGLVLMNF